MSPFSTARSQHAYTFGLAREAFQNVYVASSPPYGRSVPGPGTYNIKEAIGEGAKWTLRVKPQKRSDSVDPGPGSYDSPKGVSPHGKYYWSKYKDSGNSALRSLSKRFSEGSLGPGPGDYQQTNTMKPDGRNFVSRFKSSFSRTFGSAARKIELGSASKGIIVTMLLFL